MISGIELYIEMSSTIPWHYQVCASNFSYYWPIKCRALHTCPLCEAHSVACFDDFVTRWQMQVVCTISTRSESICAMARSLKSRIFCPNLLSVLVVRVVEESLTSLQVTSYNNSRRTACIPWCAASAHKGQQ